MVGIEVHVGPMSPRRASAATATRSTRPSSDRILEAAEGVFEQNGYGETSLRQLIAAANVSTTAFYARFTSKEDVLNALISRFLTELHASASTALAEVKTLEEGFDRGVAVLVKVLQDHRVVAGLALTEAAGNPKVRATLGRSYRVLAELLTSRIKKLTAKGAADVADAEALGWALVGALQIQIMRWAVFNDLDAKGLTRALKATARTLLPALKR